MSNVDTAGVRARELDASYAPPSAAVPGQGVVTIYTAITAVVLA
jgi:hypothetical protein